MTIGDKIRKYRLLRDLTQKELGLKVGFSNTTADSRIRKYESDMMAPKEDIRSRLIEVLDVDPSALSYSQVYSLEDMIRVLFELEEEFGLKVESSDNSTSLTFDHNNPKSEKLISYLSMWKMEQDSLSTPRPTDYEKEVYENWKAQFPRDINAYFEKQIQVIEDCYTNEKKIKRSGFTPAKKVSEFILLLKSMLEAGIYSDYSFDSTTMAPRETYLEINFPTSQLVGLTGAEKELFATFLLNLEHLEDLGLKEDIHMHQKNNDTFIGYRLFCPSISSVIYDTMTRLKKHMDEADDQNEYGLMRFEEKFERDLSLYDLDLKTEIEHSTGGINGKKSKKKK